MKQTLGGGSRCGGPPRPRGGGGQGGWEEEEEERGPAAGCHVWDRRVTDLSFHTLIKSHPGVLGAFQSPPGALGKKAKQASSHNITVTADQPPPRHPPHPLCNVRLYIHGHARTSAPVNTAQNHNADT